MLRWLNYLWTAVFMLFIVADFFVQGRYEFLTAPFSAVYVSILGLYVGTKEFGRWHAEQRGRHPGELFVIAWTVIILSLFVISLIWNDTYKVSSETVAVYIMVLSVFAITQQSKAMYRHRLERHSGKR